jgi:hypothetical protein
MNQSMLFPDEWRTEWTDQLKELREASATADINQFSNTLKQVVTIGGAEGSLGYSQEGREILELLQNARDAITNPDGGDVYIGVASDGVLVANTGDPFDITKQRVRDALTMIDQSSKEGEAIGEKGVGLNAIHAIGEAFEVWTRLEDHQGLTRLRLSPSYLIGAISSILDGDDDFQNLCDTISDDALQSALLEPGDGSLTSSDINDRAMEFITNLPLFYHPIPLDPSNSSCSGVLESRSKELLSPSTEEFIDAPHGTLGQFRTAVFVEFKDDEWWDRLKALVDEEYLPDRDGRSGEEKAQAVWNALRQTEHATGSVGPETILHLGSVDRLFLERLDGDQSARQVWKTETTSRERISDSEIGNLRDDIVVGKQRVNIEDPQLPETIEHEFDLFERPGGTPRILVPQASSAADDKPTLPGPVTNGGYAPSLYYPIEGAPISFPYSFHSGFAVDPTRKNFAAEQEENEAALADVSALISDSVSLIGQLESRYSMDMGDLYPWIFLPPVPAQREGLDSNRDVYKPLRSFALNVYLTLQQEACIPSSNDPTQLNPLSEILLHWDPAVVRGFRALQQFEDIDSPDRLPDPSSLVAFLEITLTWPDRVQMLLGYKGRDRLLDQKQSELPVPETTSHDVLVEWATCLRASLSDVGDADGFVVDRHGAQFLFTGLLKLATKYRQESEDVSSRDVAELLEEELEGVAVLPTLYRERKRETPSDQNSILIPIERHGQDEGSTNYERLSRKVRWTVDSEQERPQIPSFSSDFSVYFLDSGAIPENALEILREAGQLWGIGEYDNRPDYIRDLLDAAIANGTVSLHDIGILATEYQKIEAGADDLSTNEGAFHDLNILKKGVKKDDYRRRRVKRRIGTRSCKLDLGDQKTDLTDTYFGSEWWEYRLESEAVELNAEGLSDESGLPAPSSDRWASIEQDLNADQVQEILGLLGVSALPGIEILWQRADAHRDLDNLQSWRPLDWQLAEWPETDSASVSELTTAFSTTYAAYLDYISGLDYGPGATADHSPECSIKGYTERDLDGVEVYLVSWPWISDLDLLTELGETYVSAVLNSWADEFTDSVLYTGWDCYEGHGHKGWTESVPSLLNWQLRQLEWWSGINTPTFWEKSNLAVAVLDSESPHTEYLPTVSPLSHPLNETVLEALEVERIEDLSPTQAAYRLQALLGQLVGTDTTSLPDSGLEPIILPRSPNGWRTVYRKLLQPIAEALEDDVESITDIPFLTHVPVQQGDDWYIGAVDWLQNDGSDRLYYYPTETKQWHKRKYKRNAGGNEGWLLIPDPQKRVRGFSAYAKALNGTQIEASAPIYETVDSEVVQNHMLCDEYAPHLQARSEFILAALDQTTEENVEDRRSDLQYAIENMHVAESLTPNYEQEPPAISIYKTRGEEVLLLNEERLSGTVDSIEANALAWAIALLFEQPSQRPEITLAVNPDMEPGQLEEFWEEQLAIVRGHRDIERSTRDLLRALSGCFAESDSADFNFEACIDVVAELELGKSEVHSYLVSPEEDSPAAFRTFRSQMEDKLSGDWLTVLNRFIANWGRVSEDATSLTDAIRDIEDEEHQRQAIEWVEEYQHLLSTSPVPRVVDSWSSRLAVVSSVWQDRESYASLAEWREAIDNRSQTVDASWAAEPTLPIETDSGTKQWFWYESREELRTELLEPFLEAVNEENDEPEIRQLIEQYVTTGDLLSLSDGSNRSRQQRAGRQVKQLLADRTDALENIVIDGAADGEPIFSASGSTLTGQGGGSPSQEFTERGEIAEVVVIGNVLSSFESRLDDHDIDIETFTDEFALLDHSDKSDIEYQWHLKSAWNDVLPELLDELSEDHITNWQDDIDQIADEDNPHPALRLLNVSQESGPGYDVLDPFGNKSSNDAFEEFDSLTPLPVEVKAVSGEPPYRFRITTNELRKARAFIEAGYNYELRLVLVPTDASLDPDSVQVRTHRLEDEDALRSILERESAAAPDLGFEDIVKGGYVYIKLEYDDLSH